MDPNGSWSGDDLWRPYEDLPTTSHAGYRHARGIYGAVEAVGSLNNLSRHSMVAGMKSVSSYLAIRLDIALDEINPPLFGRPQYRHDVTAVSRTLYADTINDFDTQAGTQWDGFGHIRDPELGFWAGASSDSTPSDEIGMHSIAGTPLVTRGLLLDLPRYRHESGGADPDPLADIYSAEDIAAAVEWFKLAPQPGDALCIRTGWLANYRRLDEGERRNIARNLRSAGLEPSDNMARLLWNWRLSAVACDNPAVEKIPGSGGLHRRVIPLLGFLLGELFDFESLAQHAHQRGDWRFLLMAAPLRIPGAVASPANAVAIL